MNSYTPRVLEWLLPPEIISNLLPTQRLLPIHFITEDSRHVQSFTLFAAFKGTRLDGHAFIPQAVEKGASVILCLPQTPLPVLPSDVIIIETPNPRAVYAQACARFFGKHPEMLVAVTGTNGKSSTVDFCRSLWEKLGFESASLGTLGVISRHYTTEGSHTTPFPFKLHETLSNLVHKGVTHVALEASSHGLEQSRLEGLSFQATAFLNLTRDHLDYHSTMTAYTAAKRLLFERHLSDQGTAIIYADDANSPLFEKIARERGIPVQTFGRQGNTIRILSQRPTSQGQVLDLYVEGESHIYTLTLPFVGLFQALNILAASLLVKATTDISLLTILKASTDLPCVNGRLEHVASTLNGAHVYVDYAHTPDALEKALSALRPHTKSQLWVVFGCGGNRDTGKRPVMGAIAGRLAEHIIITDDNPRYEEASLIRDAIRASIPDALEIPDRYQAITYACTHAQEGDIILIAGKGHEKGQLIAGVTYPFEDRDVVQKVCAVLSFNATV